MAHEDVYISGIATDFGATFPIERLAEFEDADDARIAALKVGGFAHYAVLSESLGDACAGVVRRTLEAARLEPTEIDAVVYEEGPVNEVGLTLHKAIGIRDVALVGVGGQGCSVAGSALRVARDMVRSGSATNILVFLGGLRPSPRIGLADATVLSDGVCSLVVNNKPGTFRVLAANMFTNGSFAETGRQQQDFLRTYQCLETLCRTLFSEAKVSPKDIRAAFSSHLKRQFWPVPAETSRVPLKRFFDADLSRYGHSSFDNFAGLESWMGLGRAQNGARVMLLNWAQVTYSGAILEFVG